MLRKSSASRNTCFGPQHRLGTVHWWTYAVSIRASRKDASSVQSQKSATATYDTHREVSRNARPWTRQHPGSEESSMTTRIDTHPSRPRAVGKWVGHRESCNPDKQRANRKKIIETLGRINDPDPDDSLAKHTSQDVAGVDDNPSSEHHPVLRTSARSLSGTSGICGQNARDRSQDCRTDDQVRSLMLPPGGIRRRTREAPVTRLLRQYPGGGLKR